MTTRVCNFEDNNYCDWSITSSNGVEGTYGLTTAGNASSNVGNTQRPQTDFVPGNINGVFIISVILHVITLIISFYLFINFTA